MAPCASPPSVQMEWLSASVSNNSVLPERGAAMMNTGRSIRGGEPVGRGL